MITLDAVVASDQLDTGFTWATAPEWALRYECFLGDLRFKIDGADFSTHWGWVPVLDFALAMSSLLDALEPGEAQTFEFTESEAFIRLSRTEDFVEVSASYLPVTARVQLEDLRTAARDFARRLGGRLGDEHPALRQNEEFLGALRRAEAA